MREQNPRPAPIVHHTGPSALPLFLAVLLALAWSFTARAWGGKVKLARAYRPGQTMVYKTKMASHATVRSDPPALQSFLPPLPSELSAQQQNTVTVRAVHPEGTADVETRFDHFEFHSDLIQRLPEKDRPSVQQAEQEFNRRMTGETLTAHYDREGRLLSFDGADEVLQQVDAPLREPLRQILRFFLEQMGGNALYPDHRIKPGEEWKRQLSSPASSQFPFAMVGENSLRYVGKTRYHRVKAAIVDYRLVNILKPAFESLREIAPLATLQAMGLDLGVEGQGQGRVLVALDDGRILKNRSTLHERLTARLKGPQRTVPPASAPLTLEVDSDTTLEVDEAPGSTLCTSTGARPTGLP